MYRLLLLDLVFLELFVWLTYSFQKDKNLSALGGSQKFIHIEIYINTDNS